MYYFKEKVVRSCLLFSYSLQDSLPQGEIDLHRALGNTQSEFTLLVEEDKVVQRPFTIHVLSHKKHYCLAADSKVSYRSVHAL